MNHTPPTSISIVDNLALTNFTNSPNLAEIVFASDINTNLEFVKYAKTIATAIDIKFATLSGPTLAREIIEGHPTLATIASVDENVAKKAQEIGVARL